MNKTELVAAMAEQTQLSKKDTEAALKAFVDVVAAELKNGGGRELGKKQNEMEAGGERA